MMNIISIISIISIKVYCFHLKMFLKTTSTVSKRTISQITSYILGIFTLSFVLCCNNGALSNSNMINNILVTSEELPKCSEESIIKDHLSSNLKYLCHTLLPFENVSKPKRTISQITSSIQGIDYPKSFNKLLLICVLCFYNVTAQNTCPLESLGLGIWSGSDHSCSILEEGRLKCWGSNSFGQLGIGDYTGIGNEEGEMGNKLDFVSLGSENGSNLTVIDISLGGKHTCAILSNYKVKCWGNNNYGQLGLGNNNTMYQNSSFIDFGNIGVKKISAGGYHSCAIFDNDSLKCWGRNNNGQLGLGDIENRGDNVNEMGSFLPTVYLGSYPNGTNFTASQISLGEYHSCAVLSNKMAKCWGDNTYGQLGLGSNIIMVDNPGGMSNLSFVQLHLNLTVKYISAGGSHTCAILFNDRVTCWGNNEFGQLGLGIINDTVGRNKESMENLGFVDIGSYSNGTNFTASQISTGKEHTCVIVFFNDGVKCWGHGREGQLNIVLENSCTCLGRSPENMGNYLNFIYLGSYNGTNLTARYIASGNFHNCVIVNENNRTKCWGNNLSGQLGLGHSYNVGDRADHMVGNTSFVDLGSRECPTNAPTRVPVLNPVSNPISIIESPTDSPGINVITPIPSTDTPGYNVITPSPSGVETSTGPIGSTKEFINSESGKEDNNPYGLIALISIPIVICCMCFLFVYCKIIRSPMHYIDLDKTSH